MSFVVYTAITAGYDRIRDVPTSIRGGARFVAFLEKPVPSRGWEVKPLTMTHSDPTRDAKLPKILPHRLFPNAEFTLWIDGAVELLMPFSVTMLVDYLQNYDLVVFSHPRRNCLYQEAVACMHARLDDPDRIFEQVMRYTLDGFPSNLGLVEASVILRRNTNALMQFNESWWNEICKGSRRDQLSFNYVSWKQRVPYGIFPGTSRDSNLFYRHGHTAVRRPPWGRQ